MGRIEEKKADKRKRLLSSAYACFAEKGASETSIAEICTRSGIAKGTFYLYYKDKEDLEDALSRNLSDRLMRGALAYVHEHHTDSLTNNVMNLTDYIMNQLQEDNDLLKVLHNKFIIPVSAEQILDSQLPEVVSFRSTMEEYEKKTGFSVAQQYDTIASICMMAASICYSCGMYSQPEDLKTMRPVIKNIIEKTFAES